MANIGSIVLGSSGGALGIAVSAAFFLASTFHIVDKIVALVQKARAPLTTIPGHPKATEALDALEQSAIHVLQDLMTPDLLNTLVEMLKTKSLATVGEFLVVNYGPKLMSEVISQGTALLGIELAIVFGGTKGVEQAAMLRIGVAASQVVASNKAITTLASGSKLVTPVA